MAYTGRNQDRTEFKIVGQRGIPGRLSFPIATGAAHYPGDFVFPGMLYGKVLRSPYARARIKSMDISKAQALPGVKAVVTWEDPEIKAMHESGSYYCASLYKESTGAPWLGDEADREGDPVGVMVAAESEEICDEALKLIKVGWEVLPHILDPNEGLKPGAPILFPKLKPNTNLLREDNWEDGDVEAGFKEADNILEYDFNVSLRNHFNPNPVAAVAWWAQDEAGTEGKTLFIHSQQSYLGQGWMRLLLGAFKLPMDKVVTLDKYAGGRYCNFSARKLPVLAALLAKRLGRPVRMANTRRDDFEASSSKIYSHVKIGFKNDGRLTAAHGKIVSGIGPRGNTERSITMAHFRSTIIKDKAIKQETKLVYTNTSLSNADNESVSQDWGLLAKALYLIADKLGMDPTEVALKNCHTPEPSLKLCIEKGKAAIGWSWHAAGTKKLPNGKMHGLGFRYSFAYGHGKPNLGYAVALWINNPRNRDGKVYMPWREPWIGTFGIDACAMVVAEELGARIEDVIPIHVPSAPFMVMQTGSDFGAGGTWVAKEAALDLREKLLKLGAAELKVKPEELDIKDSRVYLKADPTKSWGFGDFATVGDQLTVCNTTQPPLDQAYVQSQRVLSTMNAQFCEVEVDTETGEVEITKLVAPVDCSKAIRPSSTEGQIEGSLDHTIGTSKFEDYIYDEATGVLLNGSAVDYMPPTILDVLPAVKAILVETGLANGCYHAQGVSHQVQNRDIVQTAVFNAIGKWIDSPITPDKVLKALGKI